VEKVNAIPGLVCHKTKYVTLVGWAESITFAALDFELEQLASAVTKRYKIDVPSEEANMDIDRFMAKYFWSSYANRVPNQAKTPEPLRFKIQAFGDGKPEAKLKAGVSSTPGLRFESSLGLFGTLSLGGPTKYLVVGWGAERVRRVIQALEQERRKMQVEKQAEEKAREEEEDAKFWRPHTGFMPTYRSTSEPLTLGDRKSWYMVKCDKLSGEWRDACEAMRIDIQP
jgi:hypothetical protein